MISKNGVFVQNGKNQVPITIGLIQQVLGLVWLVLCYLSYSSAFITLSPKKDEGSKIDVYPQQVLKPLITNDEYGLLYKFMKIKPLEFHGNNLENYMLLNSC